MSTLAEPGSELEQLNPCFSLSQSIRDLRQLLLITVWRALNSMWAERMVKMPMNVKATCLMWQCDPSVRDKETCRAFLSLIYCIFGPLAVSSMGNGDKATEIPSVTYRGHKAQA